MATTRPGFKNNPIENYGQLLREGWQLMKEEPINLDEHWTRIQDTGRMEKNTKASHRKLSVKYIQHTYIIGHYNPLVRLTAKKVYPKAVKALKKIKGLGTKELKLINI